MGDWASIVTTVADLYSLPDRRVEIGTSVFQTFSQPTKGGILAASALILDMDPEIAPNLHIQKAFLWFLECPSSSGLIHESHNMVLLLI